MIKRPWAFEVVPAVTPDVPWPTETERRARDVPRRSLALAAKIVTGSHTRIRHIGCI